MQDFTHQQYHEGFVQSGEEIQPCLRCHCDRSGSGTMLMMRVHNTRSKNNPWNQHVPPVRKPSFKRKLSSSNHAGEYYSTIFHISEVTSNNAMFFFSPALIFTSPESNWIGPNVVILLLEHQKGMPGMLDISTTWGTNIGAFPLISTTSKHLDFISILWEGKHHPCLLVST